MAAIDLDNQRGGDRATQRGFNLLELLIVMVVITILARIAISAYTEQVHKSRRANAFNNAGQVQLSLERWRAENPCYAPSGNGGCSATYTASGSFPFPSSTTPVTSDSYYTYTLTYSTAQPYYQLTAAPTSGSAQAGDRCGTLCAYSPGATDTSGTLICSATAPKWSNSACN